MLGLLRELQTDNSRRDSDLAKVFGMQSGTLGAMRKSLHTQGYILADRAILDPKKFGLGVVYFVQISHRDASPANLEATIGKFRTFPGTQAIYHTIGEADLLVKVRASSPEILHNLLVDIRSNDNVKRTDSISVSSTEMETMEIALEDGFAALIDIQSNGNGEGEGEGDEL